MHAAPRRLLGLAIASTLLLTVGVVGPTVVHALQARTGPVHAATPSGTGAAAGIATTPAAGTTSTGTTEAAACTPGSYACPIPITFGLGSYTAQASTTLSGMGDARWFVVQARAGQSMVVVVKGAGATRGTVYLPAGGFEGQPGGRVFDEVLPSTGGYRIRVTESPMGSVWSGRVDVIVLAY